jgi:hypothetical protein
MKKKHTLPSAFNCLKTNGCQRKLAIPSNTLIFISFLLILFSFQLSKAQMSQWALFPNKVTIPATGALSFQNIAATQPYITSNSAYDINGNLLFYIKDNQVFRPNNTSLGVLPVDPILGYGLINPEIEIVPVPNSCNKFYIIYSYDNVFVLTETLAIIIDCSGAIPFFTTTNPIVINTDGDNGTGLAVSAYIPSISGRYLFMSSMSGIMRYTITATNISSGIILVPAANITNYNTKGSEMEFIDYAPTGVKKLAFYCHGFASTKIIEISLNTVYASPTIFYYNAPLALGIEYNATGTKLFTSEYSSGLKWYNVGNANGTLITGSSNYNSTELECGANGNIYCVSNTGTLGVINPNIAIPTVASAGLAITINSNAGYAAGGAAAYTLPDQIDGEFFNNFMFPSVTAGATQTYCAGIGGNITLTATGAGTFVWTNLTTNQVVGSGASVTLPMPTTTTVYQVTATAPSGCIATATQTININPLPVISSIFGADTKCATPPVYIALPQTNINNSVYNWTIANSGTFNTTSTSSVSGVVNWASASANINGTISVTLSQTINGVTCTSAPVSYIVKPCCVPALTPASIAPIAFYNQSQLPSNPLLIYTLSSNLPSTIVSTLANASNKVVIIDNTLLPIQILQ